jgi:hypothetical protein
MSATRALDLDAAWRLHPQVALRPEPFGALPPGGSPLKAMVPPGRARPMA